MTYKKGKWYDFWEAYGLRCVHSFYHDILNMHFLEYGEWNFTWEIGRRECVKEKDFHWWMSLNNVNGMNRGFQYQLVMKTLKYLNQIHFEDLNALLCKSGASTCTIILLNCTFTSFQVYSFCCLQTFLFYFFYIGKLHMQPLDLQPMTSLSMPLLWKEKVPVELVLIWDSLFSFVYLA